MLDVSPGNGAGLGRLRLQPTLIDGTTGDKSEAVKQLRAEDAAAQGTPDRDAGVVSRGRGPATTSADAARLFGSDSGAAHVVSNCCSALDVADAQDPSIGRTFGIEALNPASAFGAAGTDGRGPLQGGSSCLGVLIASGRFAEDAESVDADPPEHRAAASVTKSAAGSGPLAGQSSSALPEPGRWYDDPAEFELLDIGARPRRPVEPDLSNNFKPHPGPPSDRLRVRARPSVKALAPWGGRFYWCAFCNYVNTESEKGAARCPRHKQDWERRRKALQRASRTSSQVADPTEETSERAGERDGVSQDSALRELAASANRARRAARAVGLGLKRPVSAHGVRARDRDAEDLMKATEDLLRHVAQLAARSPSDPG